MRRSFAEELLALFTERDVSESIVGDLVEQRGAHSRGWVAYEVARLVLALCFRSVLEAPWRALRLAALGWVVYMGASVILFIASGLPWYPWHRVHEPGFWVRLGLVIVVANLVAGGILVRRRARSGNAIAPLFALWLVGWLVSPFWAVLAQGPWTWLKPSTTVWATVLVPFLYVVPLLLGALLAQRSAATPAIPAGAGEKMGRGAE